MTQPSSPVILLAAIIGTGNEPPHQRVSKGHTGEAIGDTKRRFFLFHFAAEMFFK
jgi:hypothetical protein